MEAKGLGEMEGDTRLGKEITPSETYQIDSDEYDSDAGAELDEDDYDNLVEEAEEGFTDEEITEMVSHLKERGLINFLRDYLTPTAEGEQRSLRKLLLGLGFIPPPQLQDRHSNLSLLPYTKIVLSRILRHRQKLPHVNSIADALDLFRNSKKIIVLSGAGISTSCGIPDFRSANGLYAHLQAEGKWDLDEPQDMFDIRVFRERPEIFYSFARQIYPSNFTPSPCHRWIKSLEDRGILLRNYTQNIDTLESAAGVQRVLQCHGSFATASCLRCKTKVPGDSIERNIMEQEIPFCEPCRDKRNKEIEALREEKAAKSRAKGKGKAKASEWDDLDSESDEESEWGGGEPGIIKPDITFFGQALDSQFDECLFRDREEVDLLVIIGTSLKVAPVSEVLTHIPHSVPQIFINLTPVHHVTPDICLLGDADTIVTYLSNELGWDLPSPTGLPRSQKTASQPGGLVAPKTTQVPLDDIAWISGEDDLSHIHILSSNEAIAARKDAQTRLANQAVVDEGALYPVHDCSLAATTPTTTSEEDDDEPHLDEPDVPSPGDGGPRVVEPPQPLLASPHDDQIENAVMLKDDPAPGTSIDGTEPKDSVGLLSVEEDPERPTKRSRVSTPVA